MNEHTKNRSETSPCFLEQQMGSETGELQRCVRRKRLRKRRGIYRSGANRSGLAALEFVMTTAVAGVVLAFSGYTIIRLCRFVFSLVGSMVGSPFI